jgi:hypothetical protein
MQKYGMCLVIHRLLKPLSGRNKEMMRHAVVHVNGAAYHDCQGIVIAGTLPVLELLAWLRGTSRSAKEARQHDGCTA